jgi:hypothetical protein
MTTFGIPLTGSMSAGFTIGFIKGWQEKGDFWIYYTRRICTLKLEKISFIFSLSRTT